MRLGDLDALKERSTVIGMVNGQKMKVIPISAIDNASPVDTDEIYKKGYHAGFFATHGEPERSQGEWIRTGSLGNGNAHYECSECHYGDEHAESQEVPYCWHCGASMKKGGAKE